MSRGGWFLAAALTGIVVAYVVFEVLPARQAAQAHEAQRKAAENAVRAVLKDPQSAQFGSFERGRFGALCGTVNAKNAMGGYVGVQRYIVDGGSVFLDQSREISAIGGFESRWNRDCR